MAADRIYQRHASPNERRCISREDVGFYNGVLVGSVYRLPADLEATSPSSFFPALESVVKRLPWLCTVYTDGHTDKAYYERVRTVDLKEHVMVRTPAGDVPDSAVMQEVIEEQVNEPFTKPCPPWRVVIQPLQGGNNRCFIAFFYSHAISDGMSGAAFNKFFLQGLNNNPPPQDSLSKNGVVETPDTNLPEPFDTPQRLPISWTYLLPPLLSVLLPKFLADLIGLKSNASVVDENTWTATRQFLTAGKYKTNIRVAEVSPAAVSRALELARVHDAKLMALLQQLIVRALSHALPDASKTNLVSVTAISVRRSIGLPEDTTGEYSSGHYMVWKRTPATGALAEAEWDAVRSGTRELAAASHKLKDQPIGLLRYAPSVRKWTLGAIGSEREGSFAVSNLGSFAMPDGERAAIEKMVFSSSAQVVGTPVTFAFTSVKGGGMTCAACWQEGALGMQDEGKFVDEVVVMFIEEIENLK